MGSWQLFRLPRVTLPNFSQIGDVPQTPPLDLLDPIKKPLLREREIARTETLRKRREGEGEQRWMRSRGGEISRAARDSCQRYKAFTILKDLYKWRIAEASFQLSLVSLPHLP